MSYLYKGCVLISFCLCIAGITQAQTLRYCSNLIPGAGGTDTLALGLQSLADTTVPIRALNLSLVFDSTCSDYKGYSTLVEDQATYWGNFLSANRIDRPLLRTYQGTAYNVRFSYANADPNPNQPQPLILPPASDQPLIVFKIVFEGSCAPTLYLEDQTENPVNQIGSLDNVAIPYAVDQFACAPVGFEAFVQSIDIWPNPSSGSFRIASPESVHVVIFDEKGSMIRQFDTEQTRELYLEKSGMFVFKISNTKGQFFTRKVLVH